MNLLPCPGGEAEICPRAHMAHCVARLCPEFPRQLGPLVLFLQMGKAIGYFVEVSHSAGPLVGNAASRSSG